jgi:hypothetical protein
VIVAQSNDARYEGEVAGLQIQIVSTYGAMLKSPDQITELIESRIKLKTSKGSAYTKGINLAVLVTQPDWQFNAQELSKKLVEQSSYEGFWVILPFNIKNSISFAVNYFHPVEIEFGEGQLIVDITDNISVRYLRYYQQDGKLDDLIRYMEFKYAQNENSSAPNR